MSRKAESKMIPTSHGACPHIALWDDPESPDGFGVAGSAATGEKAALFHAFERRGNTARYLRDLKRLLLPVIEVEELDGSDLDLFCVPGGEARGHE